MNSELESVDFMVNLISNLKDCTGYKNFTQPKLRRSSVAIVLRFNFGNRVPLRDLGSNVDIPNPNQLADHLAFAQSLGYSHTRVMRKKDWRIVNLLQDATKFKNQLEILIMRRPSRVNDRWGGHACLPGGKKEKVDITDFDTAVREFNEEIGLNLKNSKHFVHLGELDDRYVKTRFGFKNLMILSTQVFLQVARETPNINLHAEEVDLVGWIPINYFNNYININNTGINKQKQYLLINIADVLFPNNPINKILYYLLGNMYFTCIPLPIPFKPTKLWGLTLSIVSDLMDMGYPAKLVCHMTPLDHPKPKLDLWDFNYLIQLFNPVNSLRKPVTSRKNFSWEHYFQTFQIFLITSVLSRGLLIYFVLKYFIPFIKKLKK